MKTRVLVSIAAIPALMLLVFFAPLWGYAIVVGLISAGAAWELLRCVEPEMKPRFKIYAATAALLMPVLYAFIRNDALISTEIFLLVLLMFFELMLSFGKDERVKLGTVLQVIFAGGIMPMLLVSMVRIGVRDECFRPYLFLPYVAAFSSDSGAYFAGCYLGKHKLFPHLSPNKTLEGCIGGVLSDIAIMLIYGYVLTLFSLKVSFPILIVYGLFGSLACQLGDLAFSAVKREFGIKDYGTIIPGHGGMLDRFDSMHFTAPMIEILALLLPAIAAAQQTKVTFMVNSISVLGSTGSIGTQTLDVAGRLGISVNAISGNSNIRLLEEQARRFKPEFVCAFDENAADKLKIALADTDIKVGSGMSALTDFARAYADCVVTAVSGSVGLVPTLAAIDEGRRIALANKETLVCAGEIVMRRAHEKGAEIIPVDSEHSAIFQCIEAQGRERAVRRILLTGSGGPFRGKTREETKNVTPAMAVAHPNWSMGAKISVDSATMMNKGLEFIEAMHLFSVTPDEMKVIIHPESVIHSMVEFIDGCVLAQLGVPDMRLPIQYALTYPSRMTNETAAPDFAALSKLTFFDPEPEKMPCLMLAMDCARRGGTAAAVMSAANETAVSLFLKEKLGYNSIYDVVADAVEKIAAAGTPTLDTLRNADDEARRFVMENYSKY